MFSEAFVPISYGGNINSIDNATTLFSLGVEKIVVNRLLFSNPQLVMKMVDMFGSQSIIASLDILQDVRGNYKIFDRCSSNPISSLPVENVIRDVQDYGVGEIFIQLINLEGCRTRIDTSFVRLFRDFINVPLIISGGVSSFCDIVEYASAGADAVGVGAFCVFCGVHDSVLLSYPNEEQLSQLEVISK